MNPRTIEGLKRELEVRGFSRDGSAPNGSIAFDDAYLSAIELGELLDVMVTRREKVFRSAAVVGADVAKRNYDDTVLAIQAIKAAIVELCRPPTEPTA